MFKLLLCGDIDQSFEILVGVGKAAGFYFPINERRAGGGQAIAAHAAKIALTGALLQRV